MIWLPKKQPFAFIGLLLTVAVTMIISSCNKMEMATPDSSEKNTLLSKNSGKSALSPAVQTARAGVIVSEHIHGFYEYLPKGYSSDTSKKLPLLICLHGIGQVGNGTTDLPGLLTYGPAMMINNGTFPASFVVDGQTFTMIIITPQLNQVGMFPLDIDSMIEYCKAKYRIDTNRIYLAGLSFGSANIWHYAGFSPATASKITAMVSMCAWTTPDNNYQVTPQEAQTIGAANIKIWETHCYNDPTAFFSWSVSQADMVSNSSPAPNPLPKLTSFNSASHDAWTTTYDPTYKESGLNIYQWMLHYEKGKTSTPLNEKVPLTQVVTLKGSNNLYVHNNGDGSPLFLNSQTFTLWEGYTVISVSGSKVALQNQNSYVTKVNPSNVACTANSIGANETFLWVFNLDGTVSFRGNTNKYLSNNNGNITCLATTIGPNEKFWINH